MSDKNAAEIFEMIRTAIKQEERDDTLAFLRKRRAAAEAVAARHPEEAERARFIVQNIGIQIEMIEQGLHVGDAALMAALEGAI